jgi:hypothetical protein
MSESKAASSGVAFFCGTDTQLFFNLLRHMPGYICSVPSFLLKHSPTRELTDTVFMDLRQMGVNVDKLGL